MRIGVHVSVRHGMVKAVDDAVALGCETFQIFSRAPHEWRTSRLTDDEARAFRGRRQAAGLHPLVVHTPYLPNLCTLHDKIFQRSVRALKVDLDLCRKLGADFFIIHPGAFSEGSTPKEGIRRMGDALREALPLGGGTRVLFENMAGGGRRLGGAWDELAAMLEAAGGRREVGVCLDTAHTLGAGHPFETAAGVSETLSAFERTIGLGRLFVIHANGSAAPRGSHRDLHTHLEDGFIRADAFQALFKDPRLRHAAVILETPRDRPFADQRNLERLKEWITS